MARLWELAALMLGLVLAGAVLAAPDVPLEARAGALTAVLAAFLVMSRTSRRRS